MRETYRFKVDIRILISISMYFKILVTDNQGYMHTWIKLISQRVKITLLRRANGYLTEGKKFAKKL